MTDKARELLELAVEWIEAQQEPRMIGANDIIKEIRAYLAKPEVKREALSEHAIRNEHRLRFGTKIGVNFFLRGVRFAEKYHGIGGLG